MQKRTKHLIIANILVLLAVIGFIIVSYIFMQTDTGKCTFLDKFKLYCPGCGGTRSLYALLQLNIIKSFVYNPAVPLGVATYIYYNVRAIIAIKRNDENYFIKQKYMIIPIVAIVIILYFVVRNILLFNGIDLIGDVLGKGVI